MFALNQGSCAREDTHLYFIINETANPLGSIIIVSPRYELELGLRSMASRHDIRMGRAEGSNHRSEVYEVYKAKTQRQLGTADLTLTHTELGIVQITPEQSRD